MQTPIRLIIADDHAVFREGLKALLATYNRFEVVAEVERSGDLETPSCLTRPAMLCSSICRWTSG